MGLTQLAIYSHVKHAYIISTNLRDLIWYLLTSGEDNGTYAVVAVADMGVAKYIKAPFNHSWYVSKRVEMYRTNHQIVINQAYALIDGRKFSLKRPIRRPSDILQEA